MNILQLCDNNDEKTDLCRVLKRFDNNIVNKYKLTNISLISYDAFVLTIDILEQYENNKDFFQKVEEQNKPIIYVYHANNVPEDAGMKLLSDRYKLNFQLSDCSVLDTPNWNYKPGIDLNNEEAYSMISNTGVGQCFVKSTLQFYIYKKGKVIIMHDLAIKYGYNKEIDKTKLANMVKYILQTDDEESNTTVEWLNNIEILDDKAIHEKYDQNIKEQDQLKKDQADLENAIEKNNYYKSLLYYSGDKLVEVVEEILEEMLSIKVDDKDYKKQDLYLKLDDKNILIEVKGVNHPFQRDNISQVKRHIKDYAEENQIYGSDVDKLCKGVLILNPYSLHNLKEKLSKDFYSKEVIEDAKYENVCTIDTLTLLNYYSKWKTNSSSVDLKKILLNSNYIKPDYDEIINL